MNDMRDINAAVISMNIGLAGQMLLSVIHMYIEERHVVVIRVMVIGHNPRTCLFVQNVA